jgi:hypothetical protein
MPYALFCDDAKVSKAYPSEADVWKHARESGLVVDVVTEARKATPRPVLDNDYEIRPCALDPGENPTANEREAREAKDFQLSLKV